MRAHVTWWELTRLLTAQTQVEVVTLLAVNTRADDKRLTLVATVPVELNNNQHRNIVFNETRLYTYA